MTRSRKLLIGLIIFFLLMTAAAYGYGVYYFTTHFLPGSRVNGINCSYMPQEEAQQTLADKTASYTLTLLTIENGQETISAQEIGLSYVEDGSISGFLHNQNRFLWFMAFSQEQSYKATVSYDRVLLDEKLNSMACLHGTEAPTDASLAVNQSGDGYEIVPETEGDQVDFEKVQNLIEEDVTSGVKVLDLNAQGCYKKPSVYSDDAQLQSDCAQLNKVADVVITYDFGDRKETIDAAKVREFMSRDENGVLNLDKTLLADFVKKLAENYDTVGTERTFSTYDNREITVSGGDYGWVIDQEKETDGLYEAITDQKTQVRDPIYSQEGAARETNDIGYTYVEINLSSMRFVLYVDGIPVIDSTVSSVGGLQPGVYYEKELFDTESAVWLGTENLTVLEQYASEEMPLVIYS